MRILLFSHSNQPGGAQNVLALLAKGLQERGHEILIVPPNQEKPPNVLAHAVISNTATIGAGLDFSQWAGIPHFWYVHEYREDTNLVSGFLTHVVMVSQALRRAWNVRGVKVIHTGIPVAECYQNPEPVVVTAGGICRRKGQMTLLQAAALVPEARFVSVGGPWERDYFTQISAERKRLGIGKNRFIMHGMKRDMESVYHQGRIFASSPEREPFGLAILEAMAHGLPVVTTKSGGPEEIVIDGETGFLVPVGDHEAMAEKIRYLLRNPEEVIRMGCAGYERVKAHFRYEDFIDQWDAYIREVAA